MTDKATLAEGSIFYAPLENFASFGKISQFQNNPNVLVRKISLEYPDASLSSFAKGFDRLRSLSSAYGINMVSIQPIVGRENGTRMLYTIVDRITGEDIVSAEEIPQEATASFEDFYQRFIKYYSDIHKNGGYFYSEFKYDQFMYGSRNKDVEKKDAVWFVDVDPTFKVYNPETRQSESDLIEMFCNIFNCIKLTEMKLVGGGQLKTARKQLLDQLLSFKSNDRFLQEAIEELRIEETEYSEIAPESKQTDSPWNQLDIDFTPLEGGSPWKQIPDSVFASLEAPTAAEFTPPHSSEEIEKMKLEDPDRARVMELINRFAERTQLRATGELQYEPQFNENGWTATIQTSEGNVGLASLAEIQFVMPKRLNLTDNAIEAVLEVEPGDNPTTFISKQSSNKRRVEIYRKVTGYNMHDFPVVTKENELKEMGYLDEPNSEHTHLKTSFDLLGDKLDAHINRISPFRMRFLKLAAIAAMRLGRPERFTIESHLADVYPQDLRKDGYILEWLKGQAGVWKASEGYESEVVIRARKGNDVVFLQSDSLYTSPWIVTISREIPAVNSPEELEDFLKESLIY